MASAVVGVLGTIVSAIVSSRQRASDKKDQAKELPPPQIPEEVVAKTAPAESAEAAASAERAQQMVERKRRGRRSTILTSGLGIQNGVQSRRPTILGTVG